MTIKGIKNMGFWARELKLPLFWLSDKNLKVFADNTLIIYKNSIIHLYYLNDKSVKGSKKIYDFFIKKSNLLKYEKNCRRIIDQMRKFGANNIKMKARFFSDKELIKKFDEVFTILNLFAAIYTKTEPLYLEKIEKNEEKLKHTIVKLSRLRLELRKEGEVLFYLLLGILIKELGRKNQVGVAELFFYTFDELIELLNKKKRVKNSIIKERAKGYVFVSLNKNYKIYTGKIFGEIYKKIILNSRKIKEIQGRVAMKGLVRGRVRLILHNKKNISKEVANFKNGEILVTEMTRPDTIMACKKASAIITDEGGITSHAAIISREFRIPCVIGTHNATQILKTGDLIEVDANKGIIKILEKYGK